MPKTSRSVLTRPFSPRARVVLTTTYAHNLQEDILCLLIFVTVQTIAGIATALLQACSPTWKAYAKQVVLNAQAMAEELVSHDYKLQTSGTDNHLVLWDLRPLGLTGSKLEKLCDLVGITINSKFTPRSLYSASLITCLTCRERRLR